MNTAANHPTDLPTARQVPGFGLIIIGSEILDGRYADKHFAACLDLLQARNHELRYCLVLPDSPAILLSQFQWAMRRDEPFFCCGGIGAKPYNASSSNASHVAMPSPLDRSAPCVLARRQNTPAASGTNAPVRVTL